MEATSRNTLITEHLARAYRYAKIVANDHPQLDACDVRSAAHMALVYAAPRYRDEGGKFWTYARHYVRGAVKDLACKPRIRGLHDCDDLFRAPSDNIEPRIAIRQLLAQLPDVGRRVLIGHDLEGHTLRQVAANLGISPSRAGKIRRKMLTVLRKRGCIASQVNHRSAQQQANEDIP